MFPESPMSKAVKDAPAKPIDGFFFQQSIAFPNPFNPKQFDVIPLPGTGIPMLDYFAAHALACVEPETQSSAGAAQWAYRVAVEMIAERERRLKGYPCQISGG